MKERNTCGASANAGHAPRLLGALVGLGIVASVLLPGRGTPEPPGGTGGCTPAVALAHPLRAGDPAEIDSQIERPPVTLLARDLCDRTSWTPTAVERPASTRAPLARPLEVSGSRQEASRTGDAW